MSESDPKLPGKERNYVAGLLKFIFVIIAFLGVMVTILFNMGGNSETLHNSLEKLISDSLNGRPTRILKLNRVTFFPSIGTDFEKLEIKETMASEELTASAEKVRLFVTFWGFISHHMGIKALYLENVDIKKGLLGRNALKIEKLFIDHDKGTQKAVVRANGALEENPWSFAMDLEVSGAVGSYVYHIGDNRDVTLSIGDLNIKATLGKQISDYVNIEKFSIGKPDDILKGQLSVSLLEGKMFKIGGRLVSGEPASIVSPDLLIEYGGKKMNIKGKIESQQLNPAQITAPEGPIALLNSVHKMLAYDQEVEQKSEKPAEPENAFICRYDFNLKFSAEKLIDKEGTESEGMEFDAVNKDGELTVTPIKGAVEAYKGPCRDMDILGVQEK